MDNEYCGLLEGELLDIVQGGGGTNYYLDLTGLPSINGVTLVGNKSGEDLGLASKNDIPDISQFATKAELPTKVSQLANDENFAKESYVDTKVAELVGAAPEMLDTIGELANAVKENQDVIGALKVPTKTSELTNDSGFITIAEVPSTNLENYYTKSETEAYVNSVVGNINTELENVLGV